MTVTYEFSIILPNKGLHSQGLTAIRFPGANKWCLDKNYAGVLIIWDRMYGTFEPERRDKKIVYGLVDQPQSFNALWLQVSWSLVVFAFTRMNTYNDKNSE